MNKAVTENTVIKYKYLNTTTDPTNTDKHIINICTVTVIRQFH